MKIKPSDIHNRTVRVVDIPAAHKNDPSEMLVTIGYVDQHDGNRCGLAVALDNQVIPAITRAINAHDALLAALSEAILIAYALGLDRPGSGKDLIVKEWENVEAMAKGEKPGFTT